MATKFDSLFSKARRVKIVTEKPRYFTCPECEANFRLMSGEPFPPHRGINVARCPASGTVPTAQNPKPRASEVAKGARLYKAFTGERPTKAVKIRRSAPPGVAVAIGKVTGIMYLAKDGGRLVHFIHRFNARSRPSLAVSPDGKRIELLGGAFRFTARGIVDLR